jgi:ketosteroid isomerase-like protein
MSRENIDRLRAAYDYTVRTGEVPPEAVHPEFVWDTTTFRGAILPGTWEGVDGANAFLAEWLEGFDQWSIDIEEVVDAGDQVIVVARQRGKARQGGPPVEQRLAQVWTFRDGLIARMNMYADGEEALEAAGLEE